MHRKENFIIFGLNDDDKMAKLVCDHLGVEQGKLDIKKFLDGEIYQSTKESVRGKDIFIIQSTSSPVNDNYMKIFMLADLLKRASAKSIVAIIPYFGYSRQEKISISKREPITASLVANLLEVSGVQHLITFDIHAPQIQGFFHIPTDNVRSLQFLIKYIKEENDLKNTVILSPDFGSVRRARYVASVLDLPIAIIDKRREKHNVATSKNVIGDIDNKDLLIIDDMIDTGNTLKESLKLVKDRVNKITIAATHGIFSYPKDKYKDIDEYLESFKEYGVDDIYITNTIDNSQVKNPILKIVDVSKHLAKIIEIVLGKDSSSLSEYFKKEWN